MYEVLNKLQILLNKKFGYNDQLLNKELTLNVTILLALTISSKISALQILDLNHFIKTGDYYEFSFLQEVVNLPLC